MASDDWIDLLNGAAPSDAAGPLLEAAAEDLAERMASDPNLEGRLVAILDRMLARSIDNKTLAATKNALATYVGEDVAFLFVYMSEPNTMADRLDEFAAVASAPAGNLVRSVIARFWTELRDAQDYSSQVADEWKSLSQEAFLDQITEKYTVRVRIEKYSGEAVVLEMSPNSGLGLVTFLMRAMRSIAAPGIFEPSNVDDLLSEVAELQGRFGAEDTDAIDATVDSDEPTTTPGAGMPDGADMPELVH